MIEILSAFREHGLDPGSVQLDGKIHRFKADSSDHKKSGWYLGFQNHTLKSGEVFEVVIFGDHRDPQEEPWKYQTDKVTYTAEDKKRIREQIKKAKEAAAALLLRAQEEAALQIEKFFNELSTTGDSQYLKDKQIADCPDLGVRFDGGTIHVPMRDVHGKLWSTQEINWHGRKKFHPGGRTGGCLHFLGDVTGASTLYLAEGLATAASVRLATGAPVVATFTADNLPKVAADLKKLYPDVAFIICGDDDKWKTHPDGSPKPNAGRIKAEEAAKLALGRAAFPRFKDSRSKHTDFNDLHVAEGLAAVADQLREVEPQPKMAVYALGFKEKEYFFTSTQNRQVVAVTAFAERDFLDLMTIDYWEALFPGSGSARVDWTTARSTLMDRCRAKGIFEARHVRGAGVWMDDGRIVVNMGDHLIVDGARVELGQLSSRYFYTLGKTLQRLHENPLSVEECATLRDACATFRWSREESGMLLAGALVTSRICGAIPVRPHCWVTGGAQTGKTTLLEKLIRPILGDSKLYVQGATTEAGVRQSLKADAVPVLFDEFETTGRKSDENIASLIELMRASWSDSGAVIVKGGASGNASHFQVRFSAIVSSIRTKLTNDADKGRFAVVELAPHGSDQEHWRKLSSLLVKIDEDYAERLFSRVIKLLPVLLSNYRVIKAALAQKADSRFGDQYGMLLAGYSLLLWDHAISAEDAAWLADNVDLSEEKEVAKMADHHDALEHLATTKLQFETAGGRREALVGELIASVWKAGKSPSADHSEKNALQRIGLRVDSEFVAIATGNHAELETRVWRGTKWSQTWGNSLARISGAKRHTVRIDKVRKCVLIPIQAFDL